MLVRMLTRWAGEQGVAQPGEIVAMSTEAAQELVSRGFAEFLEASEAVECAERPVGEVAVVETKKRRKRKV